MSGDAEDWLAAETDTLTVGEWLGFSFSPIPEKTSVQTFV